jgi:hypothetical protein
MNNNQTTQQPNNVTLDRSTEYISECKRKIPGKLATPDPTNPTHVILPETILGRPVCNEMEKAITDFFNWKGNFSLTERTIVSRSTWMSIFKEIQKNRISTLTTAIDEDDIRYYYTRINDKRTTERFWKKVFEMGGEGNIIKERGWTLFFNLCSVNDTLIKQDLMVKLLDDNFPSMEALMIERKKIMGIKGGKKSKKRTRKSRKNRRKSRKN